MPELPEVETVRQALRRQLIGRKIKEVRVFCDRIISPLNEKEFNDSLKAQTFREIRRYGKYLLFDLDTVTLVSHLRMEGKYYLRQDTQELTKHEHVIFKLDNHHYLSYHDVRKFGTMVIVDKGQENSLEALNKMGKEGNDPTLEAEELYAKIKKSGRPIKSLLLDQKIISGLGNIYVDETLFLSKINPQTKGNQLTIYHVEKIVDAARKVLNKALKLGGSTIRSYHPSEGVDGRFQNELNVHTLKDQSCKICNDTIIKTKVGGRGTYYCPTCQRDDSLLILGLTGGIGTGKSTVLALFRKQHVKVVDADKIYKNLLKNNKIMYNEIIKNFGQEIVSEGAIDRQKLGQIIFSDKEKRELLNSITHPFVLEKIDQILKQYRKQDVKLCVLDIPLLYEAHLEYLVDFVLLVYTPKSVQIKRLQERDGISEASAKLKVEAQMDIEIKSEKADIVIDNSGSKSETIKQFKEIYHHLRSEENVN
ncbi:MAG TPA: DNA-formamidopyrimidine glycosylase [Bacillota bacterium]|nr:DNA-formamidopyrimidine glycosylase [Bacillota bacterium]